MPGGPVAMKEKTSQPIRRFPGRLAISAACLAVGGGCFVAPRAPASIDHYDPVVKIPAIKSITRAQDRSAVAQLVRELDNDDPAIRFYASQALSSLTGQTLGYRYYDDELRRRPALEAWRAWLEQSSTSPATSPTGAQ